jgi:hypothetical protein
MRQRSTWNPQSSQPTSAALLWYRRLITSGLALGLLGVFIWILWSIIPPPRPTWRFAHFFIPSADLPPPDGAKTLFPGFADLSHAQRNLTKADIESQLVTDLANSGQNSLLLLYVSGRGVTLVDADCKERAYILESTWSSGDSSQSGDLIAPSDLPKHAVSVASLLGTLETFQYRTIVLLVDSGPLERDWRLGMAENRFVKLLREELEAIKDPGSEWIVLTSHDEFQHSHCSCTNGVVQQSVFGYYAGEALKAEGANANADRDEEITLAEFVRYVEENTKKWVDQASNGKRLQIPQLMYHARQDLVSRPEQDERMKKLVLKRVTKPPAKSDDPVTAQPPVAKEPDPAVVAQADKSGAAPESPDAKDKTAPNSPLDGRRDWLKKQAARLQGVSEPGTAQPLSYLDQEDGNSIAYLQDLLRNQRRDPDKDFHEMELNPKNFHLLTDKERRDLWTALHLRNRLLWELPRWAACVDYLPSTSKKLPEIIARFRKQRLLLEPGGAVAGLNSKDKAVDALIPNATNQLTEDFSFDPKVLEQFNKLAQEWSQWKSDARREIVAQASNQLLGMELRRLLPLAEIISAEDANKPGMDKWMDGDTDPLVPPAIGAAAQPQPANPAAEPASNKPDRDTMRNRWLETWQEIASLISDPQDSPQARCETTAIPRHFKDAAAELSKLEQKAKDSTEPILVEEEWKRDRIARVLSATALTRYKWDWNSPLESVCVREPVHLLTLSNDNQQDVFEFEDLKFNEELKPYELIWTVRGDLEKLKATLEMSRLDRPLLVDVWNPSRQARDAWTLEKNKEWKLADLRTEEDKKIHVFVHPRRVASPEEIAADAKSADAKSADAKSELHLTLNTTAGKREIRKMFRLPGQTALDVQIAGYYFTLPSLTDANRNPSGSAALRVPAIGKTTTDPQLHHAVLSLFPAGTTRFDLSLGNQSWKTRSLRYRWHDVSSPQRDMSYYVQNVLKASPDATDKSPPHHRWSDVSLDRSARWSPSLFPPKPAVPPKADKEGNAPAPPEEGDLTLQNTLVLEVADQDPKQDWRQWVWLDFQPLRPYEYLEARLSADETTDRDVVFYPRKDTLQKWRNQATVVELNAISHGVRARKAEAKEFLREDAKASLTYKLLLGPEKKPTAVVDVDGFPRAFRFDCDDLSADEKRQPVTEAADLRLQLLLDDKTRDSKKRTILPYKSTYYWTHLPSEKDQSLVSYRVLADFGELDSRKGRKLAVETNSKENPPYNGDRELAVTAPSSEKDQPGLAFDAQVKEWENVIDFGKEKEFALKATLFQPNSKDPIVKELRIVLDSTPPTIDGKDLGKKAWDYDEKAKAYILNTEFTIKDSESGIRLSSLKYAVSTQEHSENVKDGEFKPLPGVYESLIKWGDSEDIAAEVTIHFKARIRDEGDKQQDQYIYVKAQNQATNPESMRVDRPETANTAKEWVGTLFKPRIKATSD